jgi:3-keto-L-gulonate-6-phosphate decarboxylase
MDAGELEADIAFKAGADLYQEPGKLSTELPQ